MQKSIEHMSLLLVENAKGFERTGLHVASRLWTKNNCESLNHCLKLTVSWRSLKLVELVSKLHDIVKSQYREVQRAICGAGEFVLEYQKLDVLRSYSEKQHKRLLRKFVVTAEKCLVRSTSSEKIAIEPKHKGKKPGQQKRKVCGRTVSVTKSTKLDLPRTSICRSIWDSFGDALVV